MMAWTLRPFVGWPEREPSLFREHSHFRNAYVVLAESIWKFLHGHEQRGKGEPRRMGRVILMSGYRA
jgi:hypothetical protein